MADFYSAPVAGFCSAVDSKDGALLRFGLIEMDSRENLSLTDTVEQIISMRRLSAREVRDQLLGQARHATLEWDDFAHIGARDLAARIVETCEGGGSNILKLCLQLFSAKCLMIVSDYSDIRYLS